MARARCAVSTWSPVWRWTSCESPHHILPCSCLIFFNIDTALVEATFKSLKNNHSIFAKLLAHHFEHLQWEVSGLLLVKLWHSFIQPSDLKFMTTGWSLSFLEMPVFHKAWTTPHQLNESCWFLRLQSTNLQVCKFCQGDSSNKEQFLTSYNGILQKMQKLGKLPHTYLQKRLASGNQLQFIDLDVEPQVGKFWKFRHSIHIYQVSIFQTVLLGPFYIRALVKSFNLQFSGVCDLELTSFFPSSNYWELTNILESSQ